LTGAWSPLSKRKRTFPYSLILINPAEAKSDAQQQFTPKEFLTIMSKARQLDKFVKEVINREP
jgi:3-deoxy-D-manno-octulosonic acid (KDO) 8-phosphate synthase